MPKKGDGPAPAYADEEGMIDAKPATWQDWYRFARGTLLDLSIDDPIEFAGVRGHSRGVRRGDPRLQLPSSIRQLWRRHDLNAPGAVPSFLESLAVAGRGIPAGNSSLARIFHGSSSSCRRRRRATNGRGIRDRRGNEPGDGTQSRRFTAARRPEQSHLFSAVHTKADTANCRHRTEIHFKILDLDVQRRGH